MKLKSFLLFALFVWFSSQAQINELKFTKVKDASKTMHVKRAFDWEPAGELDEMPFHSNRMNKEFKFYKPTVSSDESLPMMLMLHGNGSRGTGVADWWAMACNEIRTLELNVFVVEPRCFLGKNWNADELIELIDYIKSKHNINDNKVYINGYSGGAFATWATAIKHTDVFAAMITAAGGTKDFVGAENLLNLPIWSFHSNPDSVVGYNNTKNIVNYLIDKGATKVNFTTLNQGHAIGKVGLQASAMEWMLRQSKDVVTQDDAVWKNQVRDGVEEDFSSLELGVSPRLPDGFTLNTHQGTSFEAVEQNGAHVLLTSSSGMDSSLGNILKCRIEGFSVGEFVDFRVSLLDKQEGWFAMNVWPGGKFSSANQNVFGWGAVSGNKELHVKFEVTQQMAAEVYLDFVIQTGKGLHMKVNGFNVAKVNSLDVKKNDLFNAVKIFEGYQSGYLVLESQLEIVTFSMYNSKGQIVRYFEVKDSEELVDVSDIKKGVYLIKLQTSDFRVVTKQIVL